MTYNETLDYLFNALPAYQNEGKSAYKENLDNTIALMETLGNPHEGLRCIHVAGTNGKGSVSHILAAVFQKCGYKVGLYTSPHLLDFRERIRINGMMISEETVINFTEENKDTFEKIRPSFFEMTVALAFQTFAKEEVDIAIIETGLGGRLDSTNIITPKASVITNISMDHAQFLGDTLEKIATEKAGIIKEGVPCIIGDMAPFLLPVFENITKEKNSELHRSTDNYSIVTQKTTALSNTFTFNKKGKYFTIETDLFGTYQAQNIATALNVIDVLDQGDEFKLPTGRVVKALKGVIPKTGLQGRWQTLEQKPLWIADTAHNEAGMAILMQQIAQLPHRKKFIIYGCVDDKNTDQIFNTFDSSFHYVFTKSKNKRSLFESHLLTKGDELKLSCQGAETLEQAIAIVRKSASKDDAVIVCGSTFLVADAIERFKTKL